VRRIFRITLFFFVALAAHAQSSCPPVQAPVPDRAKLLFTPHQEEELGQIIRQQLESEFLVIEDDQVTQYLKRIGERVVRHLPDTGLHYDFLLYDQPQVQAFSMPGGHIYVSRKIVAFFRNEDELAGLLGHELGHLAARQQALEMSNEFREVLGIKSLSGDENLAGLYNQFVESVRLKKWRPQSSDEESQRVADQLGVQAVARAGYDPQAFPGLLDRIMETKGKTGNWLSDLFGATRPDSKRLREALKDVTDLPAACIETKAPARSQDFVQWQSAVLRYRGIGHAERLSGVVSRKQLNNPLRGDIENFRFSADGKYLLAQDESGIYILTREPLRFVFRIDAVDGQLAQFSPDSRQVVFLSSGLRVETWDLEHQEQLNVADVPALHGCRQTELSPDAKYLGCLGNDLELSLYKVATGEPIFKKESFFDFDPGFSGFGNYFKLLYFLTHRNLATLRFSPDAHYFVASSRTKEEVIIDLTTEKKISISGAIHTAMEHAFTFVGPDRLVGVDTFDPKKSPLAEFPSGRVLDHVSLGGDSLIASTNPRYILVRPLADRPVGAFDLEQRKLVFSNRTSATDVWGDVAVAERLNGEIGLYKVGETETKNVLPLPLGKLGNLQTFTASPDLKWLAMSSRTRGGVWSLDSGERVFFVRGFQNAYYAPNSVFYLDFPELEKASRQMMVLSPTTGRSNERQVGKDDDLVFFGDVLIRIKHNGKNRSLQRNFELTGLDIVAEKPLWERAFAKEGPSMAGSPASGKLVLVWRGKSDGLREEAGRDPKLQSIWMRDNPSDSDYFLEVIDARTGTLSGAVVVRTGKYSFQPYRVEVEGDWLVVTDNLNRVLLYSISTGERRAKWFGYRPQVSSNGERLCLSNGRGNLTLYDLHDLKQAGELAFANPVSAYVFSEDGKRLFVLTNDQTVFLVDPAAVRAAIAATKN